MIVKPFDSSRPSHARLRAGWEAEKQMAFYLERAFGRSERFHVFHDLRLEHDGAIAQIDHLVLHPYGFCLVESKSVHGTVSVDARDEWIRRSRGSSPVGMPSPLRQVERQKDVLLALLLANAPELRRRSRRHGQHAFHERRLQTLVAIGDTAIIERKGCDPSGLHKADHITAAIIRVVEQRESLDGLAGFVRFVQAPMEDQLRFEAFNEKETRAIARFLQARDTPRKDASPAPAPAANSAAAADSAAAPRRAARPASWGHSRMPGSPLAGTPPRTPRPARPSGAVPPASPPVSTTARERRAASAVAYLCTHCHATELEIRYGRNYYLRCRACEKNTPLRYTCDRCCGPARPKKAGATFRWNCAACGVGDVFFRNGEDGA